MDVGTLGPGESLVAELTREYEVGRCLSQIAERHGLPTFTVLRMLAAAGVQVSPARVQARMNTAMLESVRQQYADGRTIKQIAEFSGFTQATVYRHFRAAGIALRPRAAGSPVPDSTVEAMVVAYESGQSITQIADRTGYSAQTVNRYLHKANVCLRRPGGSSKVDEDLLTRMVALYAGGSSIRRIADAVDISPSAVRRWLQNANVERRPASGPRKVTDALLAEMIAEYAAGASTAQIARRHGLAQATVYRRLRNARVPMSPRGPRPRARPATSSDPAR